MEFTAQQIASFIGGRVEGNEQAKVHTFAKIEEGKEGAITFLSNPKYTHFIYETKASVVLINDDVELEKPVSATLIRVPNAYECVAKLMQMYAASLPKRKVLTPWHLSPRQQRLPRMCTSVHFVMSVMVSGLAKVP